MIHTQRERWKRMSSQKDVDQGSNKSGKAKPISRSLPAGRTRQHEENLDGAYPVDGGCRGGIGTSVNPGMRRNYYQPSLVAEVEKIAIVRENGRG